MSLSPWINVNGKTYLQRELKNLSLEQVPNPYERTVLKFCQEWISNQQEFVIKTSGSTGPPKSIHLLRSQMEASAKQTIKALQLKKNDTSLVCLDPSYIAGQMMFVRSLIAEMNIVAVEPSANPFINIQDVAVDFVALVPYQLDNVLEQASEEFNRVHCAIIGGGAINHSLKERIDKCHCAIYATYGMTETISHIALQRLNGAHAQSCFEAFPSVDLRLDDRGCLCIKTDYLTEEIITNDLVDLVEKTKFRWLGRWDNIINSGGIKVIPEKVESILEKILDAFETKRRFFVAGLPDEKLGQKVTVFIEGPAFNPEIKQEILFETSAHLSKYEIPKEFLFVPQFTDTATGKINRPATIASVR